MPAQPSEARNAKGFTNEGLPYPSALVAFLGGKREVEAIVQTTLKFFGDHGFEAIEPGVIIALQLTPEEVNLKVKPPTFSIRSVDVMSSLRWFNDHKTYNGLDLAVTPTLVESRLQHVIRRLPVSEPVLEIPVFAAGEPDPTSVSTFSDEPL